MTAEAYKKYLYTQKVSEEEIAKRLRAVQAFEQVLMELGMEPASADEEAIQRCAVRMIENGSNTIENFTALEDYVLWLGLRTQYIVLVEITDCYNGMETLKGVIEKRHGTKTVSRIFQEPFPPLGASEWERLVHTRKVAEGMAAVLTPEESRAAWFQVKHGIPEKYWRKHDIAERDQYAAYETTEAFISKKNQDRIAMIQGMRDRDELWFTMEITDEVLDFVTNDLHMELGRYNGRDGIVITKVPYRLEQYLHETDARLKRYYACHCPLIREAILHGETAPADVCYCSLGHASHFLAGLGLDLEGEVLESAAQGDDRCRFIFYLPKETACD